MSEDNEDIPMFLRVHMDGENKFKKKTLTLEDFGIIINDTEEIDNSNEINSIDEFEDLIDPIEKLEKSTDKFPFSEYHAFQIANENKNLKSDFCRNFNKKITYLDFTDCKIELKTIDKDTFWHIMITDGEMSWVALEYSTDEEIPNTIFCDGTFSEEDLNILQCLINVKTGEYKYFPNKNF